MRQVTAITPSSDASRHSILQLIASTCVRRIQAVAKIIAAWARQVVMKAMNTTPGLRFEVSLDGGIEDTWILDQRNSEGHWFRVSFIDGGGRPVKYEPDMFNKFDQAVNDVNQNDSDSTLLFIATDGSRLYKAFTGPATAVESDHYCSAGFDDETFIGVWSHEWMQRNILEIEASDNPDAGWTKLMEGMVLTIAEYADKQRD
jgi:hypothetical protein